MIHTQDMSLRAQIQASVDRAFRQDIDQSLSAQGDIPLGSAQSNGQTCHSGVPKPASSTVAAQVSLLPRAHTEGPIGTKGRGLAGEEEGVGVLHRGQQLSKGPMWNRTGVWGQWGLGALPPQ